AAIAEAVGHEATADPILLADDLVLEGIIHAENGAQRPVAIDAVELDFFGCEVIVDQPVVATVDRDGRAATARIERHGHPGRLLGDQILQRRGTDVGGLYALHDVGAGKARADQLADDGAAAIAANQIVG